MSSPAANIKIYEKYWDINLLALMNYNVLSFCEEIDKKTMQ